MSPTMKFSQLTTKKRFLAYFLCPKFEQSVKRKSAHALLSRWLGRTALSLELPYESGISDKSFLTLEDGEKSPPIRFL